MLSSKISYCCNDCAIIGSFIIVFATVFSRSFGSCRRFLRHWTAANTAANKGSSMASSSCPIWANEFGGQDLVLAKSTFEFFQTWFYQKTIPLNLAIIGSSSTSRKCLLSFLIVQQMQCGCQCWLWLRAGWQTNRLFCSTSSDHPHPKSGHKGANLVITMCHGLVAHDSAVIARKHCTVWCDCACFWLCMLRILQSLSSAWLWG